MNINKQSLSAIFKSFNTLFQKAFETTENQWDKVAMMVPSSTKSETYAWLGKTTKFRKWLGDRVVQNLGTHDYTIKNESYENTIGVDRDDITDDTLGVYNPFITQMGMDSKEHPDELVFGLLKKGTSELCYDGQYFFDTDHPVGDGTTSNFISGSGATWYLMDDSKAIKPLIFQKRQDYKFVAMDDETDTNVFMRKEYLYGVDARVNVGFGLWQLAFASQQDLTPENYAAVRAAMMEVKGDDGNPLNIKPKLLVVPPSLEAAALKAVKAERDANGATNVMNNTAEVLVVPYLA